MMEFQRVILDLVTDSSDETCEQLKHYVNMQQELNTWPKSLDILNRLNDLDHDASSKFVNLLFEVKRRMDDDGISKFVLVTSLLLKKYWERVCYNLFSAVHTWTVYGMPLLNQSFDCTLAVSEEDVDSVVRNVLMNVNSPSDLEILRIDSIPKDMFNAGFTTRKGGISTLVPIASLNLYYTPRKVDSLAVIKENQQRLAVTAGFDPASIRFTKVEHGNRIRVVKNQSQESPSERYDGLVTNTPGVTITAPGADCSIILLADTKSGACGVVHSGWRGTVKGAVRETLKAMVNEYGTKPADVRAAIGPTVETACYSLPVSDAKPLTDLDSSLTYANESKPGWVHVDLVRANVILLEQDGVLTENIDTQWALCTKCNKERFFSNRRDGIPFGNQIGFISCVKKL